MPGSVSAYGDLYLDGVAFRLAAPLSVQQLATFPGKITIGDYTKDSDPRLSAWVISDLSGGHGIAKIRVGVDQNRCRWATLNTRYPEQIAPPYATTQYAGANTTGAGFLGDLYESGTYRGYAAFGTALQKWDESGLAYGSSLGTFTAQPVNKAVSFKGTGTLKLFIPMGASGYATYDGTNFANLAAGGTSPAAVAFVLWDFLLIAIDTNGQLWKTTSGNANDWTSYGDGGKLDPSYVPKNLVSFYDQAGNPTVFVVSDQGTWAFDASGPRLYRVSGLNTYAKPTAGLGSAEWRQHFFSNVGMGVRRYTGDVVQPMGLDRDDSLPLNYRGYVKDLEPENNGLYALCVGGVSGASSYAHLQVWTDYGWHTVWADTATSTTSKTTWARVSQAQGVPRLWWGDGSGSLRTILLPSDDANPRAQLVDGVGSFASGFYELQTGSTDMGMAGIDKIASHLFVKVGGSGTTGALVAEHRRNGDAMWTTLGTQSFAGGTRSVTFNALGDQMTHYSVTGDYEGLPFQDIELRLQSSDPACWIEYAVLYFEKVMPPGQAFTADLDLTAGNLDQSPEDLQQKLDALLNGNVYFETQYLHTAPGVTATSTDYVRTRLTQVNYGQVGTGQDTRRIASVAILEVPNPVHLVTSVTSGTPTFRAASATATGTGTSAVVAKPTGTADGDLLVATLAYDGTITITAVPSGWTLVRTDTSGTFKLSTYYKVASSEPASWTWTLSNVLTAPWLAFACGWSGTQTVSPFVTSSTNTGSGATATATAVSTATSNALIVAVYARPGAFSALPPSGMVERVDAANGSNLGAALDSAVQGVAGTTGDQLSTLGGSGSWLAHLMAFKASGT